MIRTDDAPATQHAFGLAAQRRSTMPAGVVKALQDPRIVTYQEYFLVAQSERLKRAGAREVARTADINPVAVPDSLQPPFILPRVEVRLRRQAPCEISKPVVANIIAT